MQHTETSCNSNFMDKWLIPQLGLDAGTLYFGQPVGKSHEVMPLDMLPNNNIWCLYEYHCALIYNLPFKHPSKSSSKTPYWISKGI